MQPAKLRNTTRSPRRKFGVDWSIQSIVAMLWIGRINDAHRAEIHRGARPGAPFRARGAEELRDAAHALARARQARGRARREALRAQQERGAVDGARPGDRRAS